MSDKIFKLNKIRYLSNLFMLYKYVDVAYDRCHVTFSFTLLMQTKHCQISTMHRNRKCRLTVITTW